MTASRLVWRPLNDPASQARLAAVLASWEGTPYMPGQSCKGVGVDCVRFVVAVLDELSGKQTDVRTIAPDAATHAPDVAMAALARLIARFDCEEVTNNVLEPGDVIATGPENRGPGHAVLVGCERRICWDATAPRVRRISLGLSALMGHQVFAVYRLKNRKWAP